MGKPSWGPDALYADSWSHGLCFSREAITDWTPLFTSPLVPISLPPLLLQVLPEDEPLPEGVCKRGKSKGAAELHIAKLKGWVPPGAAAAADQWMASHFMLISDHAG